jgi:hypothetical protein
MRARPAAKEGDGRRTPSSNSNDNNAVIITIVFESLMLFYHWRKNKTSVNDPSGTNIITDTDTDNDNEHHPSRGQHPFGFLVPDTLCAVCGGLTLPSRKLLEAFVRFLALRIPLDQRVVELGWKRHYVLRGFRGGRRVRGDVSRLVLHLAEEHGEQDRDDFPGRVRSDGRRGHLEQRASRGRHLL